MNTDWVTISELSEMYGWSRRHIHRALKGDVEIDGVEIEARPVEEADFEVMDITRRTKQLVRAHGPGPSGLSDEDISEVTEDAIEEAVASARNGNASMRAAIAWLNRVADGKEFYEKMSGGSGASMELPFPPDTQLRARYKAVQLQQELDERERSYIPRDEVANALVSVGSLLHDRMQAVPSRLADTLSATSGASDIRKTLKWAVDDILTELGNETERHLEDLLGTL